MDQVLEVSGGSPPKMKSRTTESEDILLFQQLFQQIQPIYEDRLLDPSFLKNQLELLVEIEPNQVTAETNELEQEKITPFFERNNNLVSPDPLLKKLENQFLFTDRNVQEKAGNVKDFKLPKIGEEGKDATNTQLFENVDLLSSLEKEPVSMKANEQTPEVFKEEKDEEHVQEIFLNEVKNEFNKNSTSLNVKQELVPAPISLAEILNGPKNKPLNKVIHNEIELVVDEKDSVQNLSKEIQELTLNKEQFPLVLNLESLISKEVVLKPNKEPIANMNKITEKMAKPILKMIQSERTSTPQKMTFSLTPHSLGKIEVSLNTTTNETQLKFVVQSPEVKQLLESIVPKLEQLLQKQMALPITASQVVPEQMLANEAMQFSSRSFQQGNTSFQPEKTSHKKTNYSEPEDSLIEKEKYHESKISILI